ncbi:MAG TPA: endonuclease, partial [Arenimonas sp.]
SNLSVAYMGRLADLLQWHAEDPVDAKEQLRNEAVYSYQGNRNPFIDHPEWAACIFQNQCN